jgi:2-polyprenyl-3-methyl-5-hydroxy-6-metoxy-1,4-benzoquinol methylase
VIDIYERHAHAWDASRGPDLPREQRWLDRFTEMLPSGGAILDIGCGTGDPIGRHLMSSGFDLTGIDTSAALIEIARQRFPTATWLVGDMRDLSAGRSFHGLIAWHSLFHLTVQDQRAMFERFRRHALPEAALLFTSGTELGEAFGALGGEPLYHASLDPQEYEHLLAESGFEVVAHEQEDPEAGEATVWLARFANNPIAGVDR